MLLTWREDQGAQQSCEMLHEERIQSGLLLLTVASLASAPRFAHSRCTTICVYKWIHHSGIAESMNTRIMLYESTPNTCNYKSDESFIRKMIINMFNTYAWVLREMEGKKSTAWEETWAFFLGLAYVSDSLNFPFIQTTGFCKPWCILVKLWGWTQTFQTSYWLVPSCCKAGFQENSEEGAMFTNS